MKKYLLIFVAALVGLAVIAAAYYTLVRPNSGIPPAIMNQINFGVFYPGAKGAVVQQDSFIYDSTNKSVSYIVVFAGTNITFAEQSSPDSFADDPTYYPKFVELLNGYTKFQSVDGRVDLTRPKEVGSQTAVMNAKGTLLFAKSDSDISEDNWRLLFNSMKFAKPK